MEYNFIFWADFVPQGTSEDHVYNTSSTNGLQEITISSEGRQAGNEYADAYYASKPVDLTLSGQSIGKVELTRPFGKIRLIATDAVDGQLGDRPGTATVTYGTDLTLPGTFNALTGKASGRGAYICNDPACVEKCVKKRIFDKVFGVRLSDEDYASIAEQYGDKP